MNSPNAVRHTQTVHLKEIAHANCRYTRNHQEVLNKFSRMALKIGWLLRYEVEGLAITYSTCRATKWHHVTLSRLLPSDFFFPSFPLSSVHGWEIWSGDSASDGTKGVGGQESMGKQLGRAEPFKAVVCAIQCKRGLKISLQETNRGSSRTAKDPPHLLLSNRWGGGEDATE
ncbi:hypothetical protein CDAR_489251 [Caerostris darwini]|uniref:Uncharacterized protein n=1 Tax=Caerostris darwini TaxID=1538125 RepID=A0AAV4SZX2_9ARAC|nr:hypothetical protein CDAR_489251 [Caerostris darwini]